MSVAFETTVFPHAGIQRTLSLMAKRGMTQVVSQCCRFNQRGVNLPVRLQQGGVLVERDGDPTGDLRHFHRMRQPGAGKIAHPGPDHLRFGLHSPKGRTVYDPTVIPFKLVPRFSSGALQLGKPPFPIR